MRLSRRARRRLTALGVVAIAIVGFAAGWKALRVVRAARLAAQARAEGMAAYHAGDYRTALSRFSYYYSRREGKGDLEVVLAFADSRERLPEENAHLLEAAGLYRVALRLAPDDRRGLEGLLSLSRRLGLEPHASRTAQRLLEMDPDHVEALAARAEDRFYAARFDEALADARRLAALEPGRIAWRSMILRIMQRRRDPVAALLGLCDEWIADGGSDGRFRLVKAQLLDSLGREQDAAAEAAAAARLGAADLEVLQSMLALLDRLRLEEESAALIASAKTVFAESAWVWEAAVRRLWRQGALQDAAQELAESEARVEGDDAGLLRCRVLVALGLNRPAEAAAAVARLLEAAEALGPDERRAQTAWARALAAHLAPDSSFRELVEACTAALAEDPADLVINWLLGEAFERAGEHDLAAASFERAARADPRWRAPRVAAARSLLAAGRPIEALGTMVALLRDTSDSSLESYLLLARAWLSVSPPQREIGLVRGPAGRGVTVVELLEALRAQRPDDPQVGALLLRAFAAVGRVPAARDLGAEILARGPDAATLLALAEASGEDLAGPLSDLVQRAAASEPWTLEMAEALAWALHRAGRTEEGLALLDDAPRQWPDRVAEARRRRAAYLAWAAHPQAIPSLHGVLEDEPRSLESAVLVLAQRCTWEDPALLRRAAAQMEAAGGGAMPQPRLARAALVLHESPGDQARLAEAIVLVGDVLRETPRSLRALVLMGSLLLAGPTPEVDRALVTLGKAVDLYPDRVELYPALIALHQRQGSFEAAGPLLERFAEFADREPALTRTEVQLLCAAGEFEKAATRLAQCADRGSEADRAELAHLQWRAGRDDEAGRIYAELVGRDSCGDVVLEAAADFYASHGRIDEALRALRRSGRAADPAGEALLLGEFHRRHGRPGEAARLFQEAVRLAPQDPDARGALALHLLETGDLDGARREAAAGLALRSDHALLRTTHAIAGLQLENSLRGEAAAIFAGAEESPALADALSIYQQAADAIASQGAPARRHLTAATRLVDAYPGFLPGWKLAIALHARAGEPDAATRLAVRAADRLPDRAEPAEWATHGLIAAGNAEGALDMANRWRRRSAHRPLDADVVAATLELELDRTDEALRRLEPHATRILAEHHNRPDRVAAWMGALLLEGEVDRAASLLRELLPESGRWREAWLAWCRLAGPDVAQEALEAVEPALRGDGGRDLLVLAGEWAALARRSRVAAHFDRAESLAAEASGIEDLAVESRRLRGGIAVSRKDWEAADEHFRRVREARPADPAALNDHAYALLRRGRTAEGLELSARAVALAPGDAVALDTYAQALRQAARLEEAEAAALKAQAAGTGDPGPHMTLSWIFLEWSRLGDARRELARADVLYGARPEAWAHHREDLEALREEIARRAAGTGPTGAGS
jgi:predicted Zn-dependent protease